ncbi:MAG: lipid-A-disaccharide synthase [Bacteroides sp.]|jgi:lipid-A-disaccharide synthase|nr:lipid-A-disaccharide synthase [Bacteroides sp.]
MKYYLIAGEASGDLHASNLMRALMARDGDARFRIWGGDRMVAQGGELVKHITELAFMGFLEVLLNLRTILRNIALCKKDLLKWKPDVLILIDYPGFNLRMAKFAREQGIRVVYYISPQIWAWKQSRVKQIRRDVDRMLVILPFEKTFYERFGVEVHYVGHPLLDALEEYTGDDSLGDFLQENQLAERPIVALLPGSRKQELSASLKLMASMVRHFPAYQFVVAGVKAHPESYYQELTAGTNIRILFGQTYRLLAHARAALVTSGTATLETALFGVPQAVCYRAGRISYLIARRLVKVKYISLVNLVMDRPLVREMIQDDFNARDLKQELNRLLNDQDYVGKILSGYSELRHKLGDKGASEDAASHIIDFLQAGN